MESLRSWSAEPALWSALATWRACVRAPNQTFDTAPQPFWLKPFLAPSCYGNMFNVLLTSSCLAHLEMFIKTGLLPRSTHLHPVIIEAVNYLLPDDSYMRFRNKACLYQNMFNHARLHPMIQSIHISASLTNYRKIMAINSDLHRQYNFFAKRELLLKQRGCRSLPVREIPIHIQIQLWRKIS